MARKPPFPEVGARVRVPFELRLHGVGGTITEIVRSRHEQSPFVQLRFDHGLEAWLYGQALVPTRDDIYERAIRDPALFWSSLREGDPLDALRALVALESPTPGSSTSVAISFANPSFGRDDANVRMHAFRCAASFHRLGVVDGTEALIGVWERVIAAFGSGGAPVLEIGDDACEPKMVQPARAHRVGETLASWLDALWLSWKMHLGASSATTALRAEVVDRLTLLAGSSADRAVAKRLGDRLSSPLGAVDAQTFGLEGLRARHPELERDGWLCTEFLKRPAWSVM